MTDTSESYEPNRGEFSDTHRFDKKSFLESIVVGDNVVLEIGFLDEEENVYVPADVCGRVWAKPEGRIKLITINKDLADRYERYLNTEDCLFIRDLRFVTLDEEQIQNGYKVR